MTTLDDKPKVRAGWRTPAALYRLISSPALRAVLGWDLPRRDVKWVRREEGMTCLEVGSGGGFYTAALREHLGEGTDLIALDPAGESLDALRDKLAGTTGARMSYLVGDGCKLPMPDDSVDALFYGYSLEEFPDPLGAVLEAQRVLRPGGQLVLFLWRPVITKGRRMPVAKLLDQTFDRQQHSAGPQNIRMRYIKRAR
ncbi:class I SAM-dependent methyltransferase [Amycolatopsis suaedae]|uniref:Methyltransferase domain-containing protein n=1 Tax=Amycolatopsis suaedae TaxID=2510978 RepID=A0A4Q7J9W0_9PSEU|nr:class I SAM-dependent methyltransferase [Amycolatopsis suaedae]RZQ63692.1 methyltransferase domain-containing protein [Amycolatopsis suaedae]